MSAVISSYFTLCVHWCSLYSTHCTCLIELQDSSWNWNHWWQNERDRETKKIICLTWWLWNHRPRHWRMLKSNLCTQVDYKSYQMTHEKKATFIFSRKISSLLFYQRHCITAHICWLSLIPSTWINCTSDEHMCVSPSLFAPGLCACVSTESFTSHFIFIQCACIN